MCGFVSAFSSVTDTREYSSLLKQSADLIRHRGPDDEAYYLSTCFSAGFRRLKIIDLSNDARQPMSDVSGRYWIVFNGEIYNYREIRTELSQSGIQFRTQSDTEALLQAFVRWGPDCLTRLNGMFAFLIWDEQERQLFGARDRFGEKPLFWAKKNGCLFFASEIKSLFPLLRDVPNPNLQVVRHYLQGRQADSATESFYEGIQSISPAHMFLAKDNDIRTSRYWKLEAKEIDCNDAVSQVRDLFFDSVKLRMRADVPVGTCLSGGIDSSAIACTMAQLDTSQLPVSRHTFTAGYSEFDESSLVRQVNEQTGSRGHTIVPRPDSLFDLEILLKYHDEPFHSFAAYAGFKVMELSKKNGIVVLLNGQGADELFAGYSKYISSYIADLLLRGRLWAARKVAGQAECITGKSASKSILKSLKKIGVDGMKMASSSTGNWLSRRDQMGRSALGLTAEFCRATSNPNLTHPGKVAGRVSTLKRQLYGSLTVAHLPLYLRVEDRNSMANSLESRLPFLDYRLAEYVFSLPTALFMQNGTNKFLFRQAMKDVLPKSVVERKEKYGFPTPEKDWIFGHLSGEIRDLIYSNSFCSRDVFNSKWVQAKFQQDALRWQSQRQAVSSESRSYWFRLIALELWSRSINEWRSRISGASRQLNQPINVVNHAAKA